MSNTNNKKKIVGISIISAIIVMLSSVFIYANVVKPQKYSEYMDLGNKYLLEENYEEAILAFEKAIKIDAKSTEARVGAAKSYIGNNELDRSIEILEEAQEINKMSEELLKEILEILTDIEPDVAYEFLDRFVNSVGQNNISQEINSLLDSANESPSEPIANLNPGTYIKPISIKLNVNNMKIGHSYYYTTDGSEPNKDSKKYRGKIDIQQSTTIKLIGYNKNGEFTEVSTLKYIIDKEIVQNVKTIIADGKKLINDTTVGDEIGNISKTYKDRLKMIIDEANDLLSKESTQYKDIIDIKIRLENSIKEFKENIIKPVDKSKLELAISKANNLYNNAVEGSQKGQYKSGSKSILMSAINKAKKVYNNSSAKQDEINLVTSSLNSAINTFNSKKITKSDRDSDGNYSVEYLKSYLMNTGYYTSIDIEPEYRIYNNEKCYFVWAGIGEGTDHERGAQFCIGAKSLKNYQVFDVMGY